MHETEADTCRKYVLPKLYAAGWTDEQINEQHTFTDGRIVPTGNRIRRRKQKRADYRLRIARDFPIALVEAKASYKTAGEGLQQAKDYATILDLKFAYATNGTEIIEFDFLTGKEQTVEKWFKLKRRKETDQAWKVAAKDLIELDESGSVVFVNLDVKNPNSAEALEHLPPEQLVEDILQKEHRIIEIMDEIQGVLKGSA